VQQFIRSNPYQEALFRESNYWGTEIERALEQGIPFSVDMRNAERIWVQRGDILPQQQFYDPKAEWIMNGTVYKRLFDEIDRLGTPQRILHLACGGGGLSLEMARHGHYVTGIDISEKAITIAKKFAQKNGHQNGFGHLDYRIEDLNAIELPAQNWDIVIGWNGFHHILYLERLMKQIKKALVPGGKLVYSENIGSYWSNHLIGGMIYFFLPTFLTFRQKLSFAFLGSDKVKENMKERSPFEHVHSDSILSLTRKFFRIQDIYYHNALDYRSSIVGDNKLPDNIRYPFIRFLRDIDSFLLKYHLLKPDHALVIATV